MNILFVCSKNRWRSRTAETIFKNNGEHPVKSAGTKPDARIRINASLMDWADMVFVMEEEHLNHLEKEFGNQITTKIIHVLGIPDEYQYMDDELIEILQVSVKAFYPLNSSL